MGHEQAGTLDIGCDRFVEVVSNFVNAPRGMQDVIEVSRQSVEIARSQFPHECFRAAVLELLFVDVVLV